LRLGQLRSDYIQKKFAWREKTEPRSVAKPRKHCFTTFIVYIKKIVETALRSASPYSTLKIVEILNTKSLVESRDCVTADTSQDGSTPEGN
jgi:hypothetical protein